MSVSGANKKVNTHRLRTLCWVFFSLIPKHALSCLSNVGVLRFSNITSILSEWIVGDKAEHGQD